MKFWIFFSGVYIVWGWGALGVFQQKGSWDVAVSLRCELIARLAVRMLYRTSMLCLVCARTRCHRHDTCSALHGRGRGDSMLRTRTPLSRPSPSLFPTYDIRCLSRVETSLKVTSRLLSITTAESDTLENRSFSLKIMFGTALP